MQWLNSTGIAVSLFFILFILGKKNRKRADYLLILINLLMISFLSLDLLIRVRLTTLVFFFQSIAPYLLFPVYLFFALDTVQEKIQNNSRWALLFIPALISTIFLFVDLFVLHSYDTVTLQTLYEEPPISYHILYKGNQLLFLAALILLIRKLKKYSQDIKEQFSFIDPIQLNWLTQTSWVYLAITVVSILIFVVSNFQWLPININSAYTIVSSCIVFAVFYISFYGIRQYTVIEYYGRPSAEPSTQLSESPLQDSPTKYKTSSLTSAEQEAIFQSLLQLFENRNLFLEPKLQLQEVADLLNITTHNLSQTINSITGKPFYDFVNGYRVKHLQKLLADPSKKKFTILALGMDSGFNSKASLNRIFKEETGLSPKEYQLRNLPK
jgi:AraC-like DNA-binding protein